MKDIQDTDSVNGNEEGLLRGEVSELASQSLLIRDAIFVRNEGNLIKLKHVDILWLKGDGNYTTIVSRHSVFSVRNILKDFEEVLPLGQFIRIHKSYIIRIDEIISINTKEIKVDKDWVPVGRTYYHSLVDRIQKLNPSGD
jgi:DNA-binding LytR/AlgR family response regulator